MNTTPLCKQRQATCSDERKLLVESICSTAGWGMSRLHVPARSFKTHLATPPS